MSRTFTFALIKPETCAHPFICWKILRTIMQNDLSILSAKICRVKVQQAEEFYLEHKGKFFYNRLVGHVASGPVLALILSGSDAIARWRSLLGATKVFKTVVEQPDTLRGQFGMTDTRNVAHGSDSFHRAVVEANFFFPEFCDTVENRFRASLPSVGLDERELFNILFQNYSSLADLTELN